MGKKSKIKDKKTKTEPVPNPFELKFNRQKYDILGRKRDIPGQPIAKKKTALDHRMKTLGVEVANVYKKNKIVDKRLGQKNAALNKDERASQRFVALRKSPKNSKFNLSDNNEDTPILTHRGQALTMMEKYDRMEESESEGEEGGLGAEIVARAHFGGGITENDDGGNGQGSTVRKSRADVIKEMIAKSKMERHARLTEKDQILDTVDRLDDNFKNLVQKMNANKRDNNTSKSKKEMSAYDKTMIELKLSTEAKATPADKIQQGALAPTREEIDSIREESERRQRLAEAKKNMEINTRIAYYGEPKEKKSSKSVRFQAEDEDDEDEEEIDDEDEEISVDGNEEQTLGENVKESVFVGMPRRYEEFIDLLAAKEKSDIPDLIKRIAKSHHPSLKEGNKDIIARLFLFTLRYYDDRTKEIPSKENIDLLCQIEIVLFHLSKFDVEHSVKCIRAFLVRLWKNFIKDNKVTFTLISAVKLVFGLFPMSSEFHPVSTVAISIASAILSAAQIKDANGLGRSLLLSSIILEFVHETKSFFPELLAFLSASIQQTIPESDFRTLTPINSLFNDKAELLYFEEDLSNIPKVDSLSLSEVFQSTESSNKAPYFVVKVLAIVLSQIQQVSLTYASQYPLVYSSIFKPIGKVLELMPIERLPAQLNEQISTLLVHLKAECVRTDPRTQMTIRQAEPKMLKMLEPRLDENFNPEQKHAVREGHKQGKRGEIKKLQYELKRERKGALKELRKDTQFIAKRQFESQKRLDSERKQKVKQIMSGLQGQQSEHVKEKNAARMHNKKMKNRGRKKH